MITQYLKPEVKLTIEPATTLYDVVNDTVDKIAMYATVTKKTSDVAQVEFFVNGTSKNVVTNFVSFYHNNANQNRFGIDVNYGNLIHELRITKCLDADLTANYATVTAFMNTGCVMSRIYYKTYSTDWTSTKDYVESLT